MGPNAKNSIKPNENNSIKQNENNSIKPNEKNSIKPNENNSIKTNENNSIKAITQSMKLSSFRLYVKYMGIGDFSFFFDCKLCLEKTA